MKLALSPLGKIKLGIHAVQSLLIFVTICIAIAMNVQDGKLDGRGIYFNIMCYISILALIYLAVVPLWERSQRLANTYAFLAVDVTFAILWLAAWAALVAWNRAGMAAGADKLKLGGSGNCTTFAASGFGVQKKCDLANVCVGFGVVICLMFIATAVVSFLYVRKIMSDQNALSPWLGKSYSSSPDGAEALEAGKDNTWSTDTGDISGGGEGASGYNHMASSGASNQNDRYQLLNDQHNDESSSRPYAHQTLDDQDDQHNRYDVPPYEEDSTYHGAHGNNHSYNHGYTASPYDQDSSAPPYDDYHQSSAYRYDDEEDRRGRR